MLNTIHTLSRLLAWINDKLNIPGEPTTSHCRMLTPYLRERCLPLTSRCSATGRTRGYLTSSKAFLDTVSTVQVSQQPVRYNSVLVLLSRSKDISTGSPPLLRKIISRTPFFISTINLLLLGMNQDYHSLKEGSLLEGIV